MEKALKVINEMQKKNLIADYAIGGGIAAIFYIEPILTHDLDIFFNPPGKKEGLMLLSSIYEYLKNKGYSPIKEHVLIEGIPVQLLPVYNELVGEAIEQASPITYKNVKTRIVKAEYLIAIMIQTYRPKDRERAIKFIDESQIDRILLDKILLKYNLKDKFEKLMRFYHED